MIVKSLRSKLPKKSFLIEYLGLLFSGVLFCWSFGLPLSTLPLLVVWLHLGPITLLQYGGAPSYAILVAIIIIGIHLACIFVYFIWPNKATTVISFLSIAVWFLLGTVSVLMGI